MHLILKLLFKLHLTEQLRRLGLRLPWIYEEVEKEWFGSAHLNWDRNDVERAFNLATQIRGLHWVLGNNAGKGAFPNLPGIGRRGGYSEFLRVYWFGCRIESIIGAPGSKKLMDRLLNSDPDANEEATAIHLLRAGESDIELEIEPSVEVGGRSRNPDFRIRTAAGPWVYVEVTRLHRSEASIRVQAVLRTIVERMMAIEHPFVLEIILNREPTPQEAEAIVSEAVRVCGASNEPTVRVSDVAAILVKSGDPRVIVPSLTPDDNEPRMAVSQSVVGPDAVNRQLIARVPFADERAEDILRYKARQLPKNECGLLMVNVNVQPTAFVSWSERIPQRFTPDQHTRVAGAILFMHATSPSEQGLIWVPYVKLIPNPHAAIPIPQWINQRVQTIREKTNLTVGRPD